MRDRPVHLPLAGVRLPDATTGRPLHLGELPGVQVLTLVRHRY